MEVPHLQNPFPGLRPFEFEESHLFFGRDDQIIELVNSLSDNKFVAVVGPSGSGKSSLVNAGLVPNLYEGFMGAAGSGWYITKFRPGNAPIEQMAQALVRMESEDMGKEIDRPIRQAILETTLRSSQVGLIEAVRQVSFGNPQNILLIVDQFEEIFRFKENIEIKTSDEEASDFVKLLLRASEQQDLPIYIVITMRSDYLGHCAQFHGLPKAINDGQYLVPRLTRSQIREVVERPVLVSEGEISPLLVQQLLNDVGDDPDQLPVLQHALMRSWDHWERSGYSQGEMRLEDYQAVGGIANALSQHADEVYNELPDERRKKLAELIFRRVTEISADTSENRNPTELSEICNIVGGGLEEIKAIIERFRAPGRSFLMPPVGNDLKPDSVIDISHESLIRVWDRLREWGEDEAESARTYQRLAETAALHKIGKAGLSTHPELGVAIEWRDKNEPNRHWAKRYNPAFDQAMKFLQASEFRYSRSRRRTVAAVVGVVLISVLVAWFSLWNANRASKNEAMAVQAQSIAKTAAAEAKENEDRAVKAEDEANLQAETNGVLSQNYQLVASSSRAYFGTDSDLSILLAIEAVKYGLAAQDNYEINIEPNISNLHQSLTQEVKKTEILTEHTDTILYSEWSPDGFSFVTLGRDGLAIVWDGETLEPQITLESPSGEDFLAASWHPTEPRLVTVGVNSSIDLWDLRSGEATHLLDGETYRLGSGFWGDLGIIAWSPDGTSIASVANGNDAVIFDMGNPTGEPIYLTGEHKNLVYGLHWSPDGSKVVTAGKDGNVRIWNAKTGELLRQLNDHSEWVNSVDWSSDGSKIATGSDDNTAILWDAETGKRLYDLDLGDQVWDVHFNPDGSLLTTFDREANVRVWDVNFGTEIAFQSGHQPYIYSGSWNPKDNYILSVDRIGQVLVWDVFGQNDQNIIFQETIGESLYSSSWSPDGRKFIVGSDSGSVYLWDLDNLAYSGEIDVFTEHFSTVNSIQWSPIEGNTTLISQEALGTSYLWNITGEVLQAWSNFQPRFNPDGNIVLLSNEGYIQDLSGNPNIFLARQDEQQEFVFEEWSPDGEKVLAIDNWGSVYVWDSQTGEFISKIEGDLDLVFKSAYWSPNSDKLLLVDSSDEIFYWSIDETTSLLSADLKPESERWEGTEAELRSVEWSPVDNEVFMVNYDGKISLWSIPNGNVGELDELNEETPDLFKDNEFPHFSWSPDGLYVLTVQQNGDLHILDAKTYEEIYPKPISGQFFFGDDVTAISWSHDSSMFAAAGRDSQSRIWDVTSGKMLTLLYGHDEPVQSLAWSADDKLIATGGTDGQVRVYFIEVDPLLEAACERVNRNLTYDEWRQYIQYKNNKYHQTCINLPVHETYINHLVEIGDELASQRLIDIDFAVNSYTLAKSYSYSADVFLDFDPRERAVSIRIAPFYENAEILISNYSDAVENRETDIPSIDLEEGIENIKEAQRISEEYLIDPYWKDADLSELLVMYCVFGSFAKLGEDTVYACDQAISVAETDEEYLEEIYFLYLFRGIAYGIVSTDESFEKAIADFETVLSYFEDDEETYTEFTESTGWDIENWIEELKNGNNPFTTEFLEDLWKRLGNF